MKKLLIILLSALSLTAMAQQKKVAVLKVVDRQNELSEDLKFILRSNIERAITNTPGYEAYTRADIDVILGEHDFQRTGLVKDEEIQKIGEMTGVSLILVTEAVLTGSNQLYVSVKLLDVIKGQNIKTEDMPMGKDIESIRLGCAELANLLLGTINVYDSKVTYLGHNEYLYQGKKLNSREYELLLLNNCSNAYQIYRKGKNTTNIGWGCLGGGTGFLLMGGIMLGCGKSNDNYNLVEAGATFMALGGVSMIVGTTVLFCGYPIKNKALEIYNQSCASSSRNRYALQVGITPEGIGLAINF